MHLNNKNKFALFSIRSLFFLVLFLFLLCLAALPLVIKSAVGDFMSPPYEQSIAFTPANAPIGDNFNQLHIHVVDLDEVHGQAKLKVHGYRSCNAECDEFNERILFFDADRKNDNLEDAIPIHVMIEMPSNSVEFIREISVPMRGSLFLYPFDSYKIALGVAVQRQFPDGSVLILSPKESEGRLRITIEDNVSKADLTVMKDIDPKSVKPKKLDFEYAYAKQMKFERPLYSIITVMLVIILSIAVTAFTMLTRAFDQLVINTSALIFGVWSIRSLLLNGYPSDITLLDTVLQCLVVFILMVVAFRSMNFFHRAGLMRILPWAKEELTRECPECISEIKFHAKRCPHCTSTIG